MLLRGIRYYQEEVKTDSIWLTIYSDMMTNLMLFFLMMLGLAQMPEEMREKITQGLENNFRSQTAEVRIKRVIKKFREEESVFQMKQVIDKKDLKTFSKVEIDEEKIKLTMQSPVLFSPGEAELNGPKARLLLKELAAILYGLPNQIIIEGHTDNMPVQSGVYKNNWELSIARALSVERMLEQFGVHPAAMAVAGYGEFTPLYPNDTPVGRAFNRRIEISIIR